MKVVIGSDDAGYPLKENIKEYLTEIGVEYEDVGAHSTEPVDYPDIAYKVTKEIKAGKYKRGILICGTGIGMAIAANKIPGIYAAVCHDIYSAERARKSNDSNVMTVGAKVIGPELARKMVSMWLSSEFAGGRSARKVSKIKRMEEEVLKKAGKVKG